MMSGSNAALIDTNVLVYAYDPRDRQKQDRALLILDRLIIVNRAVLSVQCLTEFFTVVTRRLPEPLGFEEATVRVERLVHACRTLDLTPAVVLEGCRGSVRHGLSLWDALIWAIAKLNQVPYVITEDAEHGKSIEGVRYLNPFASSFDASLLEIRL